MYVCMYVILRNITTPTRLQREQQHATDADYGNTECKKTQAGRINLEQIKHMEKQELKSGCKKQNPYTLEEATYKN